VLEDLHWADEATLDVVRMLARRLESVPVLLAATYRDDSLDRRHPLRLVLGELPSSRHVIHLTLAPLSAEAVATLAGPADGAVLHRRRAATRSSSRKFSLPAGQNCRRPFAKPSSLGQRASTTQLGVYSTPSQSCHRVPSSTCCKRLSTDTRTVLTNA
jgi:hypothetical protein